MPSWLLLSLAAITFLNRYAFLAESFSYSPGPRVRRFLSYSSFAVLTAIWTPLVFQMQAEGFGLSVAGLDYAVGAFAAAALTLARVPSLVVVIASTGLFFALRFLVL